MEKEQAESMAVEPTLLEMEAVTSVGEKVATTEKEPTMVLLTGMSKVEGPEGEGGAVEYAGDDAVALGSLRLEQHCTKYYCNKSNEPASIKCFKYYFSKAEVEAKLDAS